MAPIARTPSAVHRFERILVGLDGSQDASAAAHFAAALARRVDAEVIGIHAEGLLEAWGDDSIAGKHIAVTRELLREKLAGPWREPLLDVRHRVELRDGNPVQVLLTAAEELDVDLIVVGTKGAGGLAEQLMGSTSTQLAEHASVPVVVVPGARRARPGVEATQMRT